MPLALVSPYPLTVMDLFEESVIRGPFPDSFTSLLRGAEALVRALPPDYCVEADLGPICGLEHYAALAWAISHFGDAHYRAAASATTRTADCRVGPSNPTPDHRPDRRPMDDFTYQLGLCLQKLVGDGRLGYYRAHGWLGPEGVGLDPGWFVSGNVTFDALGNAIEFADGRGITGIEGRWEGSSTPAEPVPTNTETEADDDDGNDDSGEMAGPPVSAAVDWMRRREAEALLSNRLLKKRATVDEGRATLKIGRLTAERAFDDAVPPDRRRRRGGQKTG